MASLDLQVKITDLQVRGTSRSLHAGDPQCAPSYVALGQATVDMVRSLHTQPTYTPLVNNALQVNQSALVYTTSKYVEFITWTSGLYMVLML